MNYHRMSTERLRSLFKWTTYGKRGSAKPRQVLLKDMTEKHLRNCLKNDRLSRSTKAIFGREIRYRMSKGISDKGLRPQTRRVRFGLNGPETDTGDLL